MVANCNLQRYVTTTTVSICVYLLISLMQDGGQVNADRACQQPDTEMQPEGTATVYHVAYNVNYSSTARECMTVIVNNTDPTIERGTFRFKTDNIFEEGSGYFVTNADGSRMLFTPKHVWPTLVHFDHQFNGVTVAYICEETTQSILVMYPYGTNLELEAGMAATQLTNDPERFRMNWNNCGAPR